jgi:hypothetical protein
VRIKESFSYYDFIKFIEMFIEDTYRIKGFVKLDEKEYLVDCVGNMVNLQPFTIPSNKPSGEIVVLSGSKMPVMQSLKQAASWYRKDIASIE